VAGPQRGAIRVRSIEDAGAKEYLFPGFYDRWNGSHDASALATTQPRNEPVIHTTAPTTAQSSGFNKGGGRRDHAPPLARSLLVQEAMGAGHPVWLDTQPCVIGFERLATMLMNKDAALSRETDDTQF
jgi:hypothetical protein